MNSQNVATRNHVKINKQLRKHISELNTEIKGYRALLRSLKAGITRDKSRVSKTLSRIDKQEDYVMDSVVISLQQLHGNFENAVESIEDNL